MGWTSSIDGEKKWQQNFGGETSGNMFSQKTKKEIGDRISLMLGLRMRGRRNWLRIVSSLEF
jgi:hypothetical protein